MTPIRVLITARDVGTAMHLAPVVRRLRDSDEFDVRLMATDAAADHFSGTCIAFDAVDRPPPYIAFPPAETVARLDKQARAAIEAFRPDILLGGMSSFAGGIDDAMRRAAKETSANVATAMLIDTPGLHTNDRPDHFLATSGQTFDWAARQGFAKAHLVGAPKYAALEIPDVGRMRRETRTALGIGEGDRVCVFIAQGGDVPGHNESFYAFAQAMAARPGQVGLRLVIRPHPSFPDTARQYEEFAGRLGLAPVMDHARNANGAFCIADGLVTCTSTSTQDYLWLARARPQLKAVIVHLLISETLRRYLAEVRDGWLPYATETGAAVAAREESELPGLLAAIAGEAPAPTTRLWQPEVADPVGRTVAVLKAIAGRAVDRKEGH